MPTYAADTSVTVERSRSELESTVRRFGATKFSYAWGDGRAVIQFEAHGRYVRFTMRMPDPSEKQFTHTPARGTRRTAAAAEAAWEQACRQRWRALNLVTKAKLEAVEAELETFEEAFMAQIVLPNGTTISETVGPMIEQAYTTGQMPDFRGLPALGPGPTNQGDSK